ncbi:hypothetical protein THRCLA_09737 [Thraustotheca clavata]|uniref:Cyclic nucleotide-binding domain-containing protein n=1 Tax=Thraustotheca clavata TaxID=74557 RepID=A0A1V9YUH3_9STRA|nr:hypothetical protein THRCLA_09737 [Thraustotheca clavata]
MEAVIPRRKMILMEIPHEEVEPDTNSETVECWKKDEQWNVELRRHKNHLVNLIMKDPRNPAMEATLEAQQINLSQDELLERIHAAIDDLGSALYETLKTTYLRNMDSGLFSKAATDIRLLASYKVELRRQLNADVIKQKVIWTLLQEKIGSSITSPVVVPGAMTLGRFKIEALETITQFEELDASEKAQQRFHTRQIVLNQVNEYAWNNAQTARSGISHYRLSFQGLGHQESLQRLQHLLCVICHLPFLQNIAMHYKAEMVRAAQPLFLKKGHTIVSTLTTAPCLYMLVEGSVDVHNENGAVEHKEASDYFCCGIVDLLSSHPGAILVIVTSPSCLFATLTRSDFEEILEKAFAAPTQHKFITASCPKPPPPVRVRPATSASTRSVESHNSAIISASRLGLTSPKMTTHIAQTMANCDASRQFSQEYIEKKRLECQAKAQAQSNASNTAVNNTSQKKFNAKTKAQIHLLARLKISMTPHMHRPKANDITTSTALPTFEYFPRFAQDGFDVRHVELLFMGPRVSPMEEMNLVDIGPPLPESPSLIVPPKVRVDSSVLEKDQIARLCASSMSNNEAKSTTKPQNLFELKNTLNWKEEELEMLPEPTFAQFSDLRKRVSAIVVKCQKTPFSSISMYCYNWKHEDAPSTKSSPVPNATAITMAQLFGMDQDPGSALPHQDSYTQLQTNEEFLGPLETLDENNQQDEEIDTMQTSQQQLVFAQESSIEQTHGSDVPILSKLQTRSMKNLHRVNSNTMSSSILHSTHSTIYQNAEIPKHISQTSEIQRFEKSTNISLGDSSKKSEKHLFHLPSKRGRIYESVRTMPLLEKQSFARMEAYKRVIQRTATITTEVINQTEHLKELALDKALEDAGLTSTEPHSEKLCPFRIHLQERMENVLNALNLSAKTKLDLVMKYTNCNFTGQLEGALELWERATVCIKDREHTLQKIHDFELVASDPRRHFQTISTERLKEQRQRDKLFLLFQAHTDYCREAIRRLNEEYGDKVYFKDREYLEKMDHDYIELLYNLECERVRIYYNGITTEALLPTNESQANLPTQQTSKLIRAVKAKGDKELKELDEKLAELRMANEASIANARKEAMEKRRATRQLQLPQRPHRPKENTIQEALGSVLSKIRKKKALTEDSSLVN